MRRRNLMNRYLVFLLLLLALPVLGQQSKSSPAPQKNVPPTVITGVGINKNVIVLPCPKGYRSTCGICPSPPDLTLIEVNLRLSKPILADTRIEYSVSGGKLIGDGSRVQWNVEGMKVGRYSLTASLTKGSERWSSKTVSILVDECPDCNGQCECPGVSIHGPEKSATAGEVIYFTAEVSGGSQDSVDYTWNVSEGEIISGQGTPSIQVRTFVYMAGTKVTASLYTGGIDPNCNCPLMHYQDSPELLKPADPK
jgi:hypothetical protein